MIDKSHPLPITSQARLLAVSRSGVYYQPVATSDTDLAGSAAMDEIHMALPFYGIRRIRGELLSRGFDVGRQHVGPRSWPRWGSKRSALNAASRSRIPATASTRTCFEAAWSRRPTRCGARM